MIKAFFKSLLLASLLALSPLSASASTFVGGRTDFRDETIYFIITTRFYDGDSSNNTMCWDAQDLNAGDPAWRGDFKGLIEKLDYIKALGFTAIWITPIVENASGFDYHGYHARDFSKVDHRYESDDVDFQTLIDAVHAKGMKLVLDIVLNHTGNFGEENLCKLFTRDWTANQANIDECMIPYTVSDGGVMPDNYLDLASASQYSTRLAMMKNTDGVNHDTKNYWHHVGNGWNWDDYSRWYGQIAGDCVDLNTENPVVSNYLVDCYGKFIEMGVDGFRIDTSGHISPLTFNHAFIPQFTELAEKYKSARTDGQAFYMFGEVCARSQQVIYRGESYNCSPCFYTWTDPGTYDWTDDETSWDNIVVMEGDFGDQTNMNSTKQIGEDYRGTGNYRYSDNAFLNGNSYHTPDYSENSGFGVIDFPMHRRFASASNAFSVSSDDNLYNDATYNVVYVDSHDYAPESEETVRFTGSQATWAENLDLMFTWRGIPVLYYGSEVEFKQGCVIDNGTNTALQNTGRAYYGGYITGDVTATDFGEYTATGNALASLTAPLSQHIIRLNKIRQAVPALRKGQYSTDGCSGSLSFKRRYTDSTTDSYALVTISGSSTFTGILNGTYTDVVTGDVQTVTNNTLTATCSGQGNLRVYVLTTDLTSAPGKVGEDGVYIYGTSSVASSQTSYDGTQDDLLDNTEYTYSEGTSSSVVEEPEEAIEPSMSEGEQAVFFDNSNSAWSGTLYAYSWNGSTEYTGAWKGQAMTYLGNGIWKWTYTGTSVISGFVIFTNGSDQTQDLTWVNGGYYTYADGLVKTIEGAGEITGSDDDTSAATTYTYVITYTDADNTKNWNPVYCYIWNTANNDTGGSYAGTWPGSQMTYDSDAGAWTYTLTTTDAASALSVIFNNGTTNGSSVAAGTQTSNLSLSTYVTSTTTDGITAVDYDATATPVYYNLAGQRVSETAKGIVIVNGKKVVRK